MLISGGCIDLRDILRFEVAIDSDEIRNLSSEPEIRSTHSSHKHLKIYYPRSRVRCKYNFTDPYGCYNSHFLDFEDPASLVQNRFLQGIRTTLNLKNVRSIPDPQTPAEDQPHMIQESLEEELALTFETRKWYLLTDDQTGTVQQDMPGDIPKINLRYDIDYVIRATLMRNKDAKILWKRVCWDRLSLQMDAVPISSRLETADYSQLNEARNRLAIRCAEDLLQNFFKRYESLAPTVQQ